jgi:RNA polymerase sigma-54 factor
MKLQSGMVQGMEQRLLLLPQMLQAIEILQLSTQELLTRIEDELATNPALDAEPPERTELPGTPAAESEPPLPEALDWRRAAGSEDRDRKHELLSNTPAPGLTLQGFLLEQLAERTLDAAVREATTFLIGNIDRRGFLTLSDEELRSCLGADAPVGDALAALHGLEPRGIGGRDARECLLLQVDDRDPDASFLRQLIGEHLELLARNKLPLLCKAMRLTMPELRILQGKLRKLHPFPGLLVSEETARTVTPDVAVLWSEDGPPRVVAVDGWLPRLSVNPEYRRLAARRKTPAEVKSFLKDRVQSARSLMAAVAQRQETLLRVVEALVARQPGFLTQGLHALRPMRMQDVADDVGLHVSTVSRAIAGKHLETPLGTFALRELFDGGVELGGKGSGAGGSRRSVQEELKDLVAHEDKAHPLSDDDLMGMLRDRGFTVARRTIAKYRSELSIPGSWRRREY